MAATTPAAASEERRKRQKSARREAILAAARKVFAREGFEGTTIADVAREAGVAAGTVYLYYPSKLEIFGALKDLFFDVIYQAIRDAPAPPDVRGGTRARIHAVFEACSEHRDLVHLVFLNPDPRTEAARRMQRADEERMRPLAQLLAGGMEAGAVRRTDPVLLARLITGVVTVALYQCFLQADGSPDVQGYEDMVTEMIVGGITPRQP
jgi:TetR/AcrR family fatty acid metabolism transcriptional regulator